MVQCAQRAARRVTRAAPVDRDDIQGIALHGYRSQRFARYHLLSFGAGDARRVLARLVCDISSAAEPRAASRHNLALSVTGLRGLGLGERELAQFSREFRQGMAHPERAAALGDAGDESPASWEFGGPHSAPLDALWMTFASTQERLSELSQQREQLFERFGLAWQAHDAQLAEPPAAPVARAAGRSKRIPWGEFVLGYRDLLGQRSPGPFVPVKFSARPLPDWSRRQKALDFGQNGSYLVLRKLQRNAELSAAAHESCVAAHVRRALGPEQSLAHRLLRRSRSTHAGLWFMALNADIRRQFEFVQQSYFNEPALHGQLPGVDPFVGRVPGRVADGSRHQLALRLFRVRGGAYLFLPSVRALNYLAEP